uniref:Putative ovule protein n=1 Tax=Solanum chacoense TaxID=4108 RepID=A0A0V0GRX3_SOLCH
MKDRGVKMQPGCSWITVENRVHVFLVGDTSHYETEVIHSLLGNLHMKMKRTGCPPVDDSSESSDATNDKEQIIQ